MTTAMRPYVVRGTEEVRPEQALQLVAGEFGLLLYPTRRYDVRVEIRSQSEEFVAYRVARDRLSHRWSCGCPGWIFNRRRKEGYQCKHLRAMVEPLTLALELQASRALPPEAGVWR